MSSQKYWKNREEENRRKNQKTEAEYERELREIYDYMMDQIQREINGFYAKYAKQEGITLAEAKKRASKLDIEEYARKAKKYVKEKDFSKEANDEMRLYNMTMKVNRLELLKANIGLELVSGFDELQKFFDEKLTERTLEEFERQAGILGKSVLDNQNAAHAIVNASFKNATFSDRIWMYQDMMKSELAQLLKSGLIQGKNPRQLARHLEKRFGVSKYHAERLMITELARVQMEAQKQSYERNGFEYYEYVACGKGDVCEICKALDGKHFKVKDMMPGENAPPMHPSCHCSVAAWEDNEEYEAWLDYLDNGGTTEEWEKLKKSGELESDIGKSISEYFSGISKQRKIFKEGLKAVKNQDVKRLLEQSLERTAIKRSSGRKSKYLLKEKTVLLSKSAGADTMAHELFHEIDMTYGLTENGMLSESVKSDYRRLQNLSKGYGKTIGEMLYSWYPEAFSEDTKKLTLKEAYRGISDIIHGSSDGNIFLGYGHMATGYWEKERALESETFAQYGRTVYSGNEDVIKMFREIFPECWEEMSKTLERMVK